MTPDDSISHYPHTPRQEMLLLVPVDAERILDVGCNTGAFGEALKATRTIEVWGVEPNAAAAGQASERLDVVLAEPFSSSAAIPDDSFDAVVFNDVLEHIADPWTALRLAARKLRSRGCVIASIPNIRHVENLVHILRDKDFRYEPEGVRDRTHLRFFTRLSAVRLFEESGYRVTRIDGIHPRWWTPSLVRRLAFRLFRKQLEDTKYERYAFVAVPESPPAP
jgi:SAM-dependent methyltransferase